MCSELLTAGAHANYARADRGGQGPLHVACHLGLVPIVNVLLSSGAVADMPDFGGRRPLLYAAVGSGRGSQGAAGGGIGGNGAHLEVVEALIAAGARTCCKDPMSEDTALHEAARANRCDIISALLRGGACASSRNLGGQRALEVAVDEVGLGLVCAALFFPPAMTVGFPPACPLELHMSRLSLLACFPPLG